MQTTDQYMPALPSSVSPDTIFPDEWNNREHGGLGWGQALTELVGNAGAASAVRALAGVIQAETKELVREDPNGAKWNEELARRLVQVLESMPTQC